MTETVGVTENLCSVECGQPLALAAGSAQGALSRRGAGGLYSRLVEDFWADQTPEPATKMIRDAVVRIGRDADRLRSNDIDWLSSLDEFHCLGPEATRVLARLGKIGPGARVLDLG